MKIGIIGTGFIGGTLAQKLAAAGHQVKVTNTSSAAELAQKAQELGASPATLHEVVQDVDVVLLCIPLHVIPKLPADLFEHVPADVVVADTSNYYPVMNGQIDALDQGEVEGEWVQQHLGRPVVKAFNNQLAWTLMERGTAPGTPGRIAIAVAGDDARAKTLLSELVNDAGFDAVDAGSLADSWRHQNGTPGYCTELTAPELISALAAAVPGKGLQARDRIMAQLQQRTTPPTREDLVAVNRALSTTD